MESRPPQEPPRRPTPVSRKPATSGGSPTPPWLWVIVILLVALITWKITPSGETQVSYTWFMDQVKADNIESLDIQGVKASGKLRRLETYKSGDNQTGVEVTKFSTYLPPSEASIDALTKQLENREGKAGKETIEIKDGKEVKKESAKAPRVTFQPNDSANSVLWLTILLPSVIFVGLIFFMMRRARDQFDGGILGNFVKSPAKRHDKSKQRTTFDEVAGLENAKAELQEIVEFLKNPEKFQRLGGRIPKGVLLNGPPGTGKTLLARAVAGEAGVPFFSISGSEFIQMFVGVGASRVRDMFKTAKENSPCILFIDEIDAVGRIRGAGLGGGHDEREQTLNQILTEMDGFSPSESVIVLAATNRPDVLDPALLRPGRFDRHVTVDLPTKKGRLEILKVHTRNTPLDSSVDLDVIAKGTVGMSGADLANLVNESALIATREEKDKVEASDFEAARDKVVMGAKREELISPKSKRKTAYHEIGHALVAWKTPGSDPVHKVTIIPRGRALGVTHFLPEEEDRLSINESEVLATLSMALGGRAAERLVYGDRTAGAAGDLQRATRLARMMVTQWGMSERVGPVFIQGTEEHPFLGREMSVARDHSEHTQQLVDEEVARICREADERAYRILEEHRDELERLTEALLEKEELSTAEIEDLIGKRIGAPADVSIEAVVGSPNTDADLS